MAELIFVNGDSTSPQQRGNKIIAHIINDSGVWRHGLVKAISRKWKEPEQHYKQWFRSKFDFVLGQVQFVWVETDILVANMLAQHGTWSGFGGQPPIRYGALRKALKRVYIYAHEHSASVHMPKIGIGLPGGNWAQIASIINEELCSHGIAVTIYFPEKA